MLLDQQMPLEGVPPREPLCATGARERLHVEVDATVSLEVVVPLEREVTDLTLVRSSCWRSLWWLVVGVRRRRRG